ncbi:aminoglycoside phosphotransferase family protein [Actinokineospora cianjurensis]|uniref:Phosphotransferase family enzyme n=1 Tax=Actinokineospora cianjurensis TaxID=585224 RepID=A0A421AVW1_9PSEU|nr:aminoglycoside phosphotransferase family protein [Actinokineospora cianjurensis]RLK54158.1 phosphotransferase family enzyme [Actinokineospora cianjurensis]
MVEEHLVGGNSTAEVVRVGDTVRRSRSTFAAEVLRYLESAGYPYAPRHLGVDEKGRDVLSYIPGETTDHPSQRAEGAYARAGAMLRGLHDVTAGHPLAGDRACVVHGDAGPFNTIFQRGVPVAFIDWTGCRPGEPLADLAYLAWTWCVQSTGNVPVTSQAAHLRQLRDGYGKVDAEPLVDAMVQQQTRIITLETTNLDDTRLSPTRRAHASRAIEWAESSLALVQAQRSIFLTTLE